MAATPGPCRTCSSWLTIWRRRSERVRELGGEVEDVDVEGDEGSIARFGRFKLCHDDQGSSFGLHQPPSRS